jgi:hypothetical protein
MKSFTITAAALMCLTRQSSLALSPLQVRTQRPNTVCLQAKHAQKAPAHHEKWQPYFDRLTQYQNDHDGNLGDVDGDLGEWLQDQRKQYHLLKQGKKVRLTKKRAMALERAGAISSDDDDSRKARAAP